ncbi:unnamed protein product, partial [Larinioides sclopetarius]
RKSSSEVESSSYVRNQRKSRVKASVFPLRLFFFSAVISLCTGTADPSEKTLLISDLQKQNEERTKKVLIQCFKACLRELYKCLFPKYDAVV